MDITDKQWELLEPLILKPQSDPLGDGHAVPTVKF
jgi:hypothetical protein